MGSRDIKRETKKPKKSAKKAGVSEILEQQPVVEVIKKKRKQESEG